MQLKWWTKAPKEFSFDREPAMAPRQRSLFSPGALAAFMVMIAWLATAHAADLFERDVPFHISASPLAGALIEFSTQSGIQVAAADVDVASLKSSGLNGTMPIRAGLTTLLRGTGLEFARVGADTVAIRRASILPPVGHGLRARASADASATPPQIPDVTVTAPRPPTDQELAGDSLYKFIEHHGTTHYVNSPTTGDLARWRGGMQSICPVTVGLDPGYNAFVTARLRALAAYVGAPVQSDPQCQNNVQIVFTANPQARMDDVVKWATVYFNIRYSGGMKDLIAFKSDHPIQGWYMTTRDGDKVLNTDVEFVGLNVLPLWPEITQKYVGPEARFGGGATRSGIGIVILVVDTTKVVGYTIGTIADYLAMLTLSVAQSPEHCDPLPSILDLMSSGCGTAREIPAAITAGDIAFLKALYYRNTGIGPSLSRAAIQDNMLRQFKLR